MHTLLSTSGPGSRIMFSSLFSISFPSNLASFWLGSSSRCLFRRLPSPCHKKSPNPGLLLNSVRRVPNSVHGMQWIETPFSNKSTSLAFSLHRYANIYKGSWLEAKRRAPGNCRTDQDQSTRLTLCCRGFSRVNETMSASFLPQSAGSKLKSRCRISTCWWNCSSSFSLCRSRIGAGFFNCSSLAVDWNIPYCLIITDITCWRNIAVFISGIWSVWICRRAVHESVWLVWLNRFSRQHGKSGFTVPGSAIGPNRSKSYRQTWYDAVAPVFAFLAVLANTSSCLCFFSRASFFLVPPDGRALFSFLVSGLVWALVSHRYWRWNI